MHKNKRKKNKKFKGFKKSKTYQFNVTLKPVQTHVSQLVKAGIS